EFWQVTVFDAVLGAHVLVLMVVVLAKFGKPHRRESLLVEREVIAAAQVTIVPEDQRGAESGGRQILLGDGRDIARQLPRRAVALTAQRTTQVQLLFGRRGRN